MTATASGKIILFGEHAVVYQRPAIAVPVSQVQARVTIKKTKQPLTIDAQDQRRKISYTDLRDDDPLKAIIRLTLTSFKVTPPHATLTLHSTIPIASGLGSGAAVSTAIARALAKYFKRDLDSAAISSLVYEVEKIHHGTPSGIDNTVIAYSKPVYFVRGQPIETFNVAQPFRIAIADTGIQSPTKIAVGDVRAAWEADKDRYEKIFDGCGGIAQHARKLIKEGQPDQLGSLMNENHELLRQMGVSCRELDDLVDAATRAGAFGAKLSGGGRGGNMIALVNESNESRVREALMGAGAKRVLITEVNRDT
ncbi:MAG: mevalonate kinase [Chloroflexi bacterium]|nr:mevalonate kinase [Chloroflexota bacterium]